MKEKKMIKKIVAFAVAAMAACFVLVANPQTAKAEAPAKVTGLGLSAMSNSKGIFYLTWNQLPNAEFYEIEIYDKTGNNLIDTDRISSNLMASWGYDYYTNTSLKNKAFQFRVVAYNYDSHGDRVYGEWSDKFVVIPAARITKITNHFNGTVTVKWKKVSGAKDYTIYRKIGKGKFKKIKTVKGTSCDVSGLKVGKEAGFYVKANKVKIGGKKYSTPNVQNMGYTSITYSKYYSYWK